MLQVSPSTHPAPPPAQQLALPLEFPPTVMPLPAFLLDPLPTVPLERVWTSLPAATQRLIRQTVLRVLQEVVHDVQQQ
jgi:hypothetical protein